MTQGAVAAGVIQVGERAKMQTFLSKKKSKHQKHRNFCPKIRELRGRRRWWRRGLLLVIEGSHSRDFEKMTQ
jgi:hypothetical protein